MFTIQKNDFYVTGKVWYKDEYGNRLLMRRDKEKNLFVAKFRPAESDYSCEPVTVSFPLKESGVHVKLTGAEPYPESINEGIINLSEKLNDWILIMQGLANLNIPADLLVKTAFSEEDAVSNDSGKLAEIASKAILDDLAEFEELGGLLRKV